MQVEFIGVGEAFDETLPNNSQLLEWNDFRLLIDCGYAVPHALWKNHPEPDFLDAVYISHPHADHYFGLPSYMVRLAEDGRKEELLILCAVGVRSTIMEMIECAYRGLLAKIPLKIRVEEVTQGQPLLLKGATLEFAPSSHSVRNFAISVSLNGAKYAYSGDGNFTESTSRLYRDCSLLVHEAYCLGDPFHGHASIQEVIRMAEDANVRKLALTHLERTTRKNKRSEVEEMIKKSKIEVFLPEPGEIHEI